MPPRHQTFEWFASLGGFLAIVTIHCLNHQRRCNNNTNNKPDSDINNKDFSTAAPSSPLFPWEPRTTTTLAHFDAKSKPTNIQTEDDVQQQLHFLSSMTFANTGGLRQPACICCQ